MLAQVQLSFALHHVLAVSSQAELGLAVRHKRYLLNTAPEPMTVPPATKK